MKIWHYIVHWKEIVMYKSWVGMLNRISNSYTNGVGKLLKFTYENVVGDTRSYCPCKKFVVDI